MNDPMTGEKTAYLGCGTWLRVALHPDEEWRNAAVSVFVADQIAPGQPGDFRHAGDLAMSLAEAAVFAACLPPAGT
jgi:hypothetical protein